LAKSYTVYIHKYNTQNIIVWIFFSKLHTLPKILSIGYIFENCWENGSICDFSSYPFFWKLCHKHYNWKGIGFHLCYDFVHESTDCIVCWTILNIFCSRRFQQQLEIFFGQNAGLQMDMDVQQTLFKSWITLRPFRCLCYHQRQLLLFLIPSHGGKSSIFYVCLWNFYLLGPEIYSYDLFKWKHFVVLITLIGDHFSIHLPFSIISHKGKDVYVTLTPSLQNTYKCLSGSIEEFTIY